MRKNKVGRKVLTGVYAVYEIRGLNLDYLINTARNRGIELYDIKKIENKRMIVAVSLWKSRKFFAIAKELCYNIKKVREKGRVFPLVSAVRSFGLIIGAIVFCAVSVVTDDILFGFTFTGSGSVYAKQVEEYLYYNGVKPMVRFSDLDLERLEDGILSSSDRLSFASCQKRGNRLVVNLVLSKEKVKTQDGNVYALVSDCDGVIESIKVYRGTAVKCVGDRVSVGELIVDGYATIKEQTVKINVIAAVTLIAEKQIAYPSDKENQEENARLFAETALDGYEILNIDCKVDIDGDGYIYTVTAQYRRIIYAG
ncbi:MAG: sporulation protein YqfD [Clostridia bacterium]|nr:sporulation protein YqfD [Clostridia bacterium]